MAILVIHAPQWREEKENARSFESTIRLGVGDGYAIYKYLVDQLTPRCGVVIICKDKMERAEGILNKLVPTETTRNGIQRYDVHIDNIKPVAYKRERLNRCGVAVI